MKIRTKEQIVDMLEYLINEGCSELENCADCPIYQEYQKVKDEKDNSKKFDCIIICNEVYGIKRTKKQIPSFKEDD